MRKRERLLKGDHLNLVARWQHSSDVTDVAEILLLLSAGVGCDVNDILENCLDSNCITKITFFRSQIFRSTYLVFCILFPYGTVYMITNI